MSKSLLFAVALSLGIATASGPIAVYALVDKVSLEPSEEKPQRIVISGVFLTAEGQSDSYAGPQRGFLYCALPAGNEDLARREWADLKTVAGTRQVVGIGSSWSSKVRVRKTGETPGSPDDYPMGNGLVKVNAAQPRAKTLLEYQDH